ncbi:hypothetical protein [Halorubrum sp. ARQ200]|uniref:hypothetical protein n=1 Tax=Halorubrum sp. ARQ200 TaxID=1855872 RepID=UPI0018EE8194|nr:hypothetical protein [Halorubrum sp. ARQ200]
MAHSTITRKEAFAPLHDESEAYARQCWGITDPNHEQRPVSWRAEQLASYWFAHPAHSDVEAFLCWLPITIGGTPIDDPYPAWHANTTDFELVTRLHLIRLYHNWEHETALCTYLDTYPERLDALGVESWPTQSTLYTAWHDRFTGSYRKDLRTAVKNVVDAAREHGVSVPERCFTADEPAADDSSRSARSQRRLANDTAKDVWQTARPLVGPVVDFDRPDDTEIHDNAFLELHTFLGCRQDLCAETGAVDFTIETTRERTPTGSYHRNCIRSLSITQQRENHRAAMTEVIARAKQQGQLARKQHVAVDITEGDPFLGERDTEELKNQILGTKESNREVAYWYATVQIVGDDTPVVLDAMPVVRGMERATIVEELLNHATEMIEIDLVLMDREFDSEGVKDVCESFGVSYLNPSRMYGDEKRTAKDLQLDEISVEVDADAAAAGRPPRKRFWVPRANTSLEESLPDGGIPPEEGLDADKSASDPVARKAAIRRELVTDFLDIFGEDAEETVDWTLDEDLVDTLEEASYRETYAVDDDGVHHVVFETNHPDLTVSDGKTDEIAAIHKLVRFTRQYANRCGIENGYKKIKSFMADTTSTDHRYRFFNFIFACLLYSLWRLVDLLVKRSLGDERAEPRVRASTFLTIAKQNYGVGPPD